MQLDLKIGYRGRIETKFVEEQVQRLKKIYIKLGVIQNVDFFNELLTFNSRYLRKVTGESIRGNNDPYNSFSQIEKFHRLFSKNLRKEFKDIGISLKESKRILLKIKHVNTLYEPGRLGNQAFSQSDFMRKGSSHEPWLDILVLFCHDYIKLINLDLLLSVGLSYYLKKRNLADTPKKLNPDNDHKDDLIHFIEGFNINYRYLNYMVYKDLLLLNDLEKEEISLFLEEHDNNFKKIIKGSYKCMILYNLNSMERKKVSEALIKLTDKICIAGNLASEELTKEILGTAEGNDNTVLYFGDIYINSLSLIEIFRLNSQPRAEDDLTE